MLTKALNAMLACPPWRGSAAAWPCESANTPDMTMGLRVRHWPQLEEHLRTARVLRALSVMSVRPVTLRWLSLQTGWSPARTLGFVHALELEGCIERTALPSGVTPVTGLKLPAMAGRA